MSRFDEVRRSAGALGRFARRSRAIAPFFAGVASGAMVLAGFAAADASAGVAAAAGMAMVAAAAASLWWANLNAPPEQASFAPAAPEGVVRLRLDPNGDVIEARGDANGLLGLAPELLVGSQFFDRLHVLDRVAFLRLLSEMRDGADGGRLDLRVRAARTDCDGASRACRLDFRRSGGHPGSFEATLTDNSEIDRLRAGLAAAKAEAEAAEKERGRLMAGLAHELRTPLTAILGFSDLLAPGALYAVQDKRQQEYVDLIRQSGRHLLGLVDSACHVGALEAQASRIEPEAFRFADAVETSRAMLALEAEAKGVTVQAHVATSCGFMQADRRLVQQVLVILLSNAVKFTPRGGRIAVDARRLGSRLHVSVSDTGCGIAQADLGRIGSPFVRVGERAAKSEGMGLGLSLAKELVSRLRGTLTMESTFGEGTVASLSLPVRWADHADADTAKPVPARLEEDAYGDFRKSA